MKKIISISAAIFACFLLATGNCFSQGTAINTSGAAADNSAMLDVSGTTGGFLMPRMTATERNAINSPAAGLMIFNISSNCFEAYVNGAWNTVSCPSACNAPSAPVAAAASSTDCSSFVANWASSAGASSYYIDVASDLQFTGFVAGYNNINVGNITYVSVTGLSPSANYYYRVRAASMCIGGNSNTIGPVTTLSSPSSPSEGTHNPAKTQIVWNWNTSLNATGYKWNTANDYNSATDMGSNTSKTESSLTCQTAYTRYVWAYNSCGYSSVTTLTKSTTSCCNDGTGGTITHVNGKTIHTFTSSGTFTPDCAGNVEILVVAGGGGGGAGWEGCGGGGGGVSYISSYSVTTTNYTVTVGTGGSGGCCGTNVTDHSGSPGQNSSFNSVIISNGGGGGANFPPDAGEPLKTNASTGKSGGSGGGGLRSYSGGAATQTNTGGATGYGNAGGGNSSVQASNGGGGAGAAGQVATSYECGANGGDGLAFSISGTSTYYGGGGGSGGSNSSGSGGLGGGGNGALYNAQNGADNTGGGGGGSRQQGYSGGNGGSGVVIISYTTP